MDKTTQTAGMWSFFGDTLMLRKMSAFPIRALSVLALSALVLPALVLPALVLPVLVLPALAQANSQATAVASPQEIEAALKQAPKEGALLSLKPGRYDQITLDGLRAGPVRLVPADRKQPPEIHRLVIRNSLNIHVEGMDFRPTGSETQSGYLVNVDGAEGIRLEKNRFIAQPDQGEKRVRAVRIDRSSGAILRDNVVEGLERGFVFSDTRDILVEHNSLSGLTTDGFNFFEVEGVRIRQNVFTDFRTDPGQHPDYIQFWTRRAKKPSSQIEIAYNVMLQGNGTPVQGVFMDNDDSIPYRNVAIHDNLLVGGAPHGLTVQFAEGASIERNLVASSPNTTYNVSIRLLKSTRGTIRGNAATAVIATDSPDALIATNTLLPRRNVNLARHLESRLLAGLKGEAVGPLAGGVSVLPEHRTAGARAR